MLQLLIGSAVGWFARKYLVAKGVVKDTVIGDSSSQDYKDGYTQGAVKGGSLDSSRNGNADYAAGYAAGCAAWATFNGVGP